MTGNECADVEADGGQADGTRDAVMYATYADDEYDYSLVYPADWSVEPDPDGGVTFEAPSNTAGAAVFVEESIRPTPEASAAAFLEELNADEYIYELELVAQTDVPLRSGQRGRMIRCTYVSDLCDRWWLSYLFVHTDDRSYTLGVDWSDAAEFDATVMVNSFTLGAPR